MSLKLNKNAIIRIRSHIRRRKFPTLNFRAFRPKFEAIDEIMGHLTYTRKRYNVDEALRDWMVSTCVRGCHGMLHSLPVHLVDSFVHLPSSFASSPARSPCPLKPTFIPCNSFLNVAAPMRSTWSVSAGYCGALIPEGKTAWTYGGKPVGNLISHVIRFLDCGQDRGKPVSIATSR